MRVVLDARMAHWTGVGRYIRELYGAVAAVDSDTGYVVLTNPGDRTAWIPDAPNFETRPFSREIRPYSFHEQRTLGREVSAVHADLIHFPQFNVPVFGRLPYVVTIHDLIYNKFPEDCPSYLAHLAVKKVIRSAVRNARHILSVSESTKKDIVEAYGTDPDKIEVTHLGAMVLPEDLFSPERVEAARKSVGVEGPYVIYAGNHSPHKNIITFLRSLKALALAGSPMVLVVCGGRDRHTPRLEKEIAELDVGRHVLLAGYVDDEHLFPLYHGACALVFPSLYEGFGLPPLEAFACRTPVVASNVSSIPEVLGDAAILLDPLDHQGFAQAVTSLREDPERRARLIDRGLARLAAFSWKETAGKTVQIFRGLVQ